MAAAIIITKTATMPRIMIPVTFGGVVDSVADVDR